MASNSTKLFPLIGIDGDFSDWLSAERVDTPANFVPGYALYGTVQGDTYYVAIQGTAATDPVIGAGTTIYLNTDQNAATGYQLFGWAAGAEYAVVFATDLSGATSNLIAYLCSVNSSMSGPIVPDPNSPQLTYALSTDGTGLELAIPRSLLTPAGGTAPASINFVENIDNLGGGYQPSDLTEPQYTITDPATLVPATPTHRVAIVYSDTSAALYFNATAYSDLIMAAENQARMAGVSFDVIDESKLTDVNNLIGYDALVFPSMADVNTAQLPAIMTALTSAVYNYHISIITAGDFLTNDQTGAALPNPYANMQTLLDLTRDTGGNSATVTVTPADTTNPIMQGYSPGETISSYSDEGYTAYKGVENTPDVLVNQNVGGVAYAGVVETTTGATNVHFATTDLLGDSNLLSNVIQKVVLGTQPGVELDLSRQAGIVAVRMDMDQSQFPADVSAVDPNTGLPVPGVYDTLIPILEQWKALYNFVGSYYINVGDNPTPTNGADPSTTNWAVSLPYYQALEAIGGEIGDHSYTHLINPPTTTVTATTVGDTPAGSLTVKVSSLPSFAGITVGMVVSASIPGVIGANAQLAGVGGESGAVVNTTVTAVSGDATSGYTLTLSFAPNGYGSANEGVLGDIPANTQLTFSVPAENTNFLQTGTATTTTNVLSGDAQQFTYDYEFNQSMLLEEQQLGVPMYGVAVPGAAETVATSENIMQAVASTVAASSALGGGTPYLTGGWTGLGSGYPSAIGYLNPTDQSSVYIAPNMTFDFTEIQYEGKTVAQAEADWQAQYAAIDAHAAGTPVVVLPIHDYGVAGWNTTTNTGTGSPYSATLPDGLTMYQDFIAQAAANNDEFLTLEELAARYAAQQQATVNYTTAGNTITATVTPGATAPDVGGMALNVINGGTQVIQSVTQLNPDGTDQTPPVGWYAYNAQELFLPSNGGAYAITLGTAQDDVTHIDNLPSRADLVSVDGDGTNLNFSMTGDGTVVVDLHSQGTNIVSIQGAPTASITGNALSLTFADTLTLATLYAPVQHDVAIEETPTAFLTTLDDIMIGTTGNDVFTPVNNGADTFIGNGGTDTVEFSGVSTDYTVVTNADGSVTYTDAILGSKDTLIGITNVLYGLPTVTSVAFSADTGQITNDLVTNVAAQTITGTLSAPLASGDVVQVSLDDGTTWLNAAATAGTTTFTLAGVTLTASNTLLAQVVSPQNVAGAQFSAAYVLDTTPPTETPKIVAMTNDSNIAGDFITNDGSAGRTVSGTLSAPLAAGDILQVSFDSGTTWSTVTGAGTAWTAVDTTAHTANWVIEARVEDLAGNFGPLASQLAVLDTTPPTETPKIVAMTNDSNIAGDFITNDGSAGRTVSGTLSAPLAAGDILQVSFDSGTTWSTVTGAGTAWTAVDTTAHTANWVIEARVEDLAGNFGPLASQLAVLDTTAPAVAITSTGGTVNQTLQTITGTVDTADAGSTVTVLNGTTSIGTALVDSNGNWTTSVTLNGNGTYSLTATDKDTAGNVGTSAAVVYTVVLTVLTPPSAPDLTAASDSGVSSTDNITDVTTPTFVGTGALAGAMVELFDGTTMIGTGVADGAGNWTIVSPALGLGVHTLTAEQTSLGTISAPSAALAVTIVAPPPVLAAPHLAAASDTGASSSDGITSATTPTITGTGAIAGAKVSVYSGATLLGTGVATSTGAWSVVSSKLTPDGVYSLTATQTDSNGNTSAPSAALPITIETVAAQLTGLALTATSDSGRSSTDGITNVLTPTVTGGGASAGATVRLYNTNGTSVLGTGVAGANGLWTITSAALASGAHTLTAKETDLAGNVSVASAALTVTIDNTAPAAPSKAALSPPATGNTTTLTTPTFIGTAEANSTVTLYDGATVIGSVIANATTGAWTIVSSALAGGVHNISATDTDVAGNVSGSSAALAVTIQAPTVGTPGAPVLSAASDSGVSSSDGITKVTTPVFTGSATAGSTVTLYANGTTVLGTAVASTAGTWTITSSKLAAGTYQIAATDTVSGVVSPLSPALAVTIDTSAAAPSAPVLTAASDSGVSSTDRITNVTTPTFTGTGAEAGATVSLYDGTTVRGTALADASGNWTVISSTLTNGSHTLTTKETDLAGNVSVASASTIVTIDTTQPATPSKPALSGSTTITIPPQPTFTGTAEAGDSVTLYDGATIVGTGTAAATTGAWTITASTLAGGVHNITVTSTDTAGNVSASSAALTVTILTSAPLAPSTPDLVTASDTGASSTDNITKTTTPQFTGTATSGTTVSLWEAGTTNVLLGTGKVSTTGTWTIKSSTLTSGVYSIFATDADAVGNVSAPSDPLQVTIDTVVPAAPVFTGMTTSGGAATLTGTGEATDTVAVLDGTTQIGTTTVGTDGTWSFTTAAGLTNTVHTFTATQTDLAGNKSAKAASAILGSTAAETLTSTAGNNIMTGGGGADTFSFAAGFGNDVITDFVASGTHDFIRFTGIATLKTYAAVQAEMTASGGGTVISDGVGDTLTIQNVAPTSLTSADFKFA